MTEREDQPKGNPETTKHPFPDPSRDGHTSAPSDDEGDKVDSRDNNPDRRGSPATGNCEPGGTEDDGEEIDDGGWLAL